MAFFVYGFSFIFLLDFYTDTRKEQFKRFHHLSQFLLVLNAKDYSERFGVSREFAEKFAKRLDHQIRILQFLVNFYSVLTFSFFFKNFYESYASGYGLGQILVHTTPSVFTAVLVLIFFYNIGIPAAAFFIFYTEFLKAKATRLTKELNKLARKSTDQKVLVNLQQLNSLLKDFHLAHQYFQWSLMLFMLPAAISLIIFPSIVILSKKYLDNPLFFLYVLNFSIILVPIRSNEGFKRDFTIYLNTLHRNLAKNKNAGIKNPRIKLKLLKIFDLLQAHRFLSFSLIGDIFELNMEIVPKILLESVSLTFLIYTFIYSYQNNVSQ